MAKRVVVKMNDVKEKLCVDTMNKFFLTNYSDDKNFVLFASKGDTNYKWLSILGWQHVSYDIPGHWRTIDKLTAQQFILTKQMSKHLHNQEYKK
jgi:hypothetical protein